MLLPLSPPPSGACAQLRTACCCSAAHARAPFVGFCCFSLRTLDIRPTCMQVPRLDTALGLISAFFHLPLYHAYAHIRPTSAVVHPRRRRRCFLQRYARLVRMLVAVRTVCTCPLYTVIVAGYTHAPTITNWLADGAIKAIKLTT